MRVEDRRPMRRKYFVRGWEQISAYKRTVNVVLRRVPTRRVCGGIVLGRDLGEAQSLGLGQ